MSFGLIRDITASRDAAATSLEALAKRALALAESLRAAGTVSLVKVKAEWLGLRADCLPITGEMGRLDRLLGGAPELRQACPVPAVAEPARPIPENWRENDVYEPHRT